MVQNSEKERRGTEEEGRENCGARSYKDGEKTQSGGQ